MESKRQGDKSILFFVFLKANIFQKECAMKIFDSFFRTLAVALVMSLMLMIAIPQTAAATSSTTSYAFAADISPPTATFVASTEYMMTAPAARTFDDGSIGTAKINVVAWEAGPTKSSTTQVDNDSYAVDSSGDVGVTNPKVSKKSTRLGYHREVFRLLTRK